MAVIFEIVGSFTYNWYRWTHRTTCQVFTIS